MSKSDSSEDDELTVESRSKQDLLEEHGLENTAIGRAVEKQEREQERESSKRAALVEKKIILNQAEQQGLGSDPAVEALRADVHDLEGELEAEALRAEHEDDLEEARQKIDNLEGLAQRASSQNQDRLAANYRQRAASLKSEYPALADDEEPNKYSAEALGKTDDSEDAEALQEFQEFKDKKAQREADEELPEDAKARLAQYKQMRAQASTDSLRDMYQQKIDDLRAEHA